MKKYITYLLFLLLLIPVKINAQEILDNYIIMDIDSKRILKEQRKDEQILPASTTKIMTLIVALENTNATDVVKVGNEILTAEGTNIYSEIGENFLFEDLLYGMILRSGNDAALSIANYSGGSIDNFVKMMNQKARDLKLKNTYFENPTGLDDTTKNKTSVHDLALIYSYGYKNKLFKDIVGTKEYKTESDKKSYYFKNRNEILKLYNKATGGKTGYTPKAGRLLVSSAKDNDLNIVIASKGNTYGYKTHISLYENVFSKYKNYLILDKTNFKVDNDFNGKLYIKKSFKYPLAKEETNKIKKEVIFNKNKKDHVGDIIVYLEDEQIHKEKIYLKEKKQSLLTKIKKLFN